MRFGFRDIHELKEVREKDEKEYDNTPISPEALKKFDELMGDDVLDDQEVSLW